MNLTLKKLESMDSEEFHKLYNERLKEMEKYIDKEEFSCEESEDMLKLLDLKSKELSTFLNDETIESWSEIFEGVEKRLKEMNDVFEMSLLAEENHSRGLRFVLGFLEKEFEVEKVEIEDIRIEKEIEIEDNK